MFRDWSVFSSLHSLKIFLWYMMKWRLVTEYSLGEFSTSFDQPDLHGTLQCEYKYSYNDDDM